MSHHDETATAAERYWHALRVLDRLCRAKASFGTIRAAAAQVTLARESLAHRQEHTA